MPESTEKDPLKNLEGNLGEKIEDAGTAEVVHDFKNILTGILGNLSLAKNWSSPDDRAYSFIEAAERVTKHANQLALQLLANSRGGKREVFDIGLTHLIRDSVDLMIGGTYCSSNIQISSDLKMIRADQTRIIQVLNNLLVNAKQAMPEGGSITVKAGNVQVGTGDQDGLEPGEYVRVLIEDQGIGIPEEHLSKIFDHSFTTKKEGSGIGLSSCRDIVLEHNGSLQVDSEVGVGTTFTLLVPALDRIDPDVIEHTDEPVEGTGSILVLDDELMVQQAIGDMLDVFGYSVEFANDGQTAIERYKKAMESGNPYSLVIMDLTIPGGMGGLEAVQILKALDPKVKAVVSSGHANDPAIQQHKDYGFVGSIGKPYNLRDLQRMLAETLGVD